MRAQRVMPYVEARIGQNTREERAPRELPECDIRMVCERMDHRILILVHDLEGKAAAGEGLPMSYPKFYLERLAKFVRTILLRCDDFRPGDMREFIRGRRRAGIGCAAGMRGEVGGDHLRCWAIQRNKP